MSSTDPASTDPASTDPASTDPASTDPASTDPAGTGRAGTDPATTDAQRSALRAQLLATEHWGLLATRSATWSEVMSRISIHLTVTSAALVVLALVAQATGFGTPFRVLSIGLASAVLVLGTLTGMRVLNASNDDAGLILGMNRLRAAYTQLDPGLAPFLVTSRHDDLAGLLHTYTLGIRRRTVSHVLASTAMFMHVVNAMVAGTLGALITDATGAGVAAVSVVGAVAGVAYLASMVEIGRRMFGTTPIESRFPTPSPAR